MAHPADSPSDPGIDALVAARTGQQWRHEVSTGEGMACNMGKESLGIDLESEAGAEVLRKLVEKADVVHTNMRYEAAGRLHIDYESLRLINPSPIYCHTRGFERGERATLTGNDQMGAALAGLEWAEAPGPIPGPARRTFIPRPCVVEDGPPVLTPYLDFVDKSSMVGCGPIEGWSSLPGRPRLEVTQDDQHGYAGG